MPNKSKITERIVLAVVTVKSPSPGKVLCDRIDLKSQYMYVMAELHNQKLVMILHMHAEVQFNSFKYKKK